MLNFVAEKWKKLPVFQIFSKLALTLVVSNLLVECVVLILFYRVLDLQIISLYNLHCILQYCWIFFWPLYLGSHEIGPFTTWIFFCVTLFPMEMWTFTKTKANHLSYWLYYCNCSSEKLFFFVSRRPCYSTVGFEDAI